MKNIFTLKGRDTRSVFTIIWVILALVEFAVTKLVVRDYDDFVLKILNVFLYDNPLSVVFAEDILSLVFYSIMSLLLGWCNFAAATRRLHDTGRSCWRYISIMIQIFIYGILSRLFGLVPVIGFIINVIYGICVFIEIIIFIVVLYLDSDKKTNKYGPSPKYSASNDEKQNTNQSVQNNENGTQQTSDEPVQQQEVTQIVTVSSDDLASSNEKKAIEEQTKSSNKKKIAIIAGSCAGAVLLISLIAGIVSVRKTARENQIAEIQENERQIALIQEQEVECSQIYDNVESLIADESNYEWDGTEYTLKLTDELEEAMIDMVAFHVRYHRLVNDDGSFTLRRWNDRLHTDCLVCVLESSMTDPERFESELQNIDYLDLILASPVGAVVQERGEEIFEMFKDSVSLYFTLLKASEYHRDLKLQVVRGERMNGDDVLQLQRKLIALDFLPDGEDDGWFGPKTEAALIEYQRTRGLPETGIMDSLVYDTITYDYLYTIITLGTEVIKELSDLF